MIFGMMSMCGTMVHISNGKTSDIGCTISCVLIGYEMYNWETLDTADAKWGKSRLSTSMYEHERDLNRFRNKPKVNVVLPLYYMYILV